MCDVIDMKTRQVINHTMTVDEAAELLGEGLMKDEILSTRDLCAGDDQIVEACDVLLSQFDKAS